MVALARPYAPIVAGRLAAQAFDAESGSFTLRYTLLPGVAGASRIFKHSEFYFPANYSVAISPAGAASWAPLGDDAIEVTTNATAASALLRDGTEIEVVVRRADR